MSYFIQESIEDKPFKDINERLKSHLKFPSSGNNGLVSNLLNIGKKRVSKLLMDHQAENFQERDRGLEGKSNNATKSTNKTCSTTQK